MDVRRQKDDCLEIAQAEGLTKPEVAIEYDIVPTRTTNLVTSYAPDEYAQAAERTQWSQTKLNLAAQVETLESDDNE